MKLFTGCSGINNKVDPVRLRFDPQTGIVEAAECLDCDIDDSGAVMSRLGQEQISAVASHSLFHDRGDAFVVQDRASDASIYRIASDFSLAGVRSGLTKGARMSFCQVGAKTFYANGIQNGVITDGASSAWPVNTYKGPDTLKEYSPAPVGTHLAYHLGRMWIAVGPVVYASEPFKPGLFRMARCFFQFGSNIRMMRPVAGGMWLSDSEKTGFISIAENWDGQKFVKRSEYPAHEWSDNCTLVDLSKTQFQIPGMSAIWSSDEGLCIGTADGQLINVTKEKLIYPTGASGATVVDEFNVINTIY